MINNNVFTFKEFLAANSQKKLNSIDYLHAVFKLNQLPFDLILCCIQFFSPEFKVVEGRVFLSEQFDLDTYNNYLSEGKSKNEAQLWINLIELTGLFQDANAETIYELASAIVKSWNLKLANEMPNDTGLARVIYDEEMEEVFITIDFPIV